MSERLCKTCKHFSADIAGYCIRGKKQTGVDPVHGYPVYKYKTFGFASIEREKIIFGCGKSGRNWEPK